MRSNSILILCLFALIGCSGSLVRQTKTFERITPFTLITQKDSLLTALNQEKVDYSVLKLNLETIRRILLKAPDDITLIIPTKSKDQPIEIELSKVDINTDNFKVTLASSNSPVKVNQGLNYQGTIKGDGESIVAISFFDNEVMGLISSHLGNLVLGKLQGKSWGTEHILYDDKFIQKHLPFDCQTLVDSVYKGYEGKELASINRFIIIQNCIHFYIEVDKTIYDFLGGLEQTIWYVTGLMNQVNLLYAHESINSKISEIHVWDIPTPYVTTNTCNILCSYQSHSGAFNGDLAQLLVGSIGSGGIAAGFNGICNGDPDSSKSVSAIDVRSYEHVPTYSRAVEVITHEFGHLLGSQHTHACEWNNNKTQLDDCGNKWVADLGGTPEGVHCYDPNNPILPSDRGTIMSYCDKLNFVGINFSKGFGIQPGNVIRNTVANGSCIATCYGNYSELISYVSSCEQECDEMEDQILEEDHRCRVQALNKYLEDVQNCGSSVDCLQQAKDDYDKAIIDCNENWKKGNKEIESCRNSCVPRIYDK